MTQYKDAVFYSILCSDGLQPLSDKTGPTKTSQDAEAHFNDAVTGLHLSLKFSVCAFSTLKTKK